MNGGGADFPLEQLVPPGELNRASDLYKKCDLVDYFSPIYPKKPFIYVTQKLAK